MRSSCSRTSIPTAPWPTQGSITSVSRTVASKPSGTPSPSSRPHIARLPLIANSLHHELANLAFSVAGEVQDHLVGRRHLLVEDVEANGGIQGLRHLLAFG